MFYIKLLFLLLVSISLYALPPEKINKISSDAYWHTLLHLRTENISDISDPDFFLSEKLSAKNELIATLDALNEENRNETICRFPARYRYLSVQLSLGLSFSHCENFQKFLQDSRGDSVSIGFASPYLDSPMSYFGHSFIKINKLDNIYFSQTISFAAEVPKDTGFFTLLYKGITGGFTGRYIASPYFKLHENYSMIEQRSLTEYYLQLTDEEIERLLWHIYEIYDMDVKYKFLYN